MSERERIVAALEAQLAEAKLEPASVSMVGYINGLADAIAIANASSERENRGE